LFKISSRGTQKHSDTSHDIRFYVGSKLNICERFSDILKEVRRRAIKINHVPSFYEISVSYTLQMTAVQLGHHSLSGTCPIYIQGPVTYS